MKYFLISLCTNMGVCISDFESNADREAFIEADDKYHDGIPFDRPTRITFVAEKLEDFKG